MCEGVCVFVCGRVCLPPSHLLTAVSLVVVFYEHVCSGLRGHGVIKLRHASVSLFIDLFYPVLHLSSRSIWSGA